MATDLTRDELRRLARMGALRRLEELQKEEAAIRAAFPDLGRTTGKRRGRSPGGGAASAGDSGRQKRKYRMSAAQKKAVSERMKKYWAARRKAKG